MNGKQLNTELAVKKMKIVIKKTEFMLLQVMMTMISPPTKSSTRKKDAKKKGEMLGKNERRKETERGRESTEPGKERRNYSPGWRKQKERGGGK